MKLLQPLLIIFLPKLKQREKSWKPIFDSITIEKQQNEKIIWFHSASMGEFEQAKPIIESLKKSNLNVLIICTFYSPSGYENQKNYKYADAVLYLPSDTRNNVKLFLDKFHPDFCIFVRYEIWHNYLLEIKKRNIPLILIAATKPNKLPPLELYKQFAGLNYSFFDKIYTVGQKHSDYFMNFFDVSSEVITMSDPRFDRIIEIVQTTKNNPIIPKNYFNDTFIIVAGSTWKPGEEILISALKELNRESFQYQCIFVPHEPTKEHIDILSSKIDAVLLSEFNKYRLTTNEKDKQIEFLSNKHIIVDSIGKLLKLYSIADAAYIGGAFGAGVHSVTEPAGYGIPLATGPKIKGSPDAENLKSIGALKILKTSADAKNWLLKISDENEKNRIGQKARNYIKDNAGSTEIIVEDIVDYIYHTEVKRYRDTR